MYLMVATDSAIMISLFIVLLGDHTIISDRANYPGYKEHPTVTASALCLVHNRDVDQPSLLPGVSGFILTPDFPSHSYRSECRAN